MANRRKRLWNAEKDDDPLGGLVNLFDLWIVIIVALMLMLFQVAASKSDTATVRGEHGDTVPEEELVKLQRFRESPSELSGRGVRLGTAYRLENGEVVYASESPIPSDPNGKK